MISNDRAGRGPGPTEGHPTTSREARVVDTFLAVTDTLVQDFDAVEMLTMLAERCVELLDASATGIALDDGAGGLAVTAASCERANVHALYIVGGVDGPCLSCRRSGEPVACDDLRTDEALYRWPRFARAAGEAGFVAVLAVPMRLRDDVIGVLTLLRVDAGPLTTEDTRLVQALADAATIGLLHEQAVRHAEDTAEQLQGALESRVVIEQAKGALATQAGITPEDAFGLLRGYSRRNGRRLAELARQVVEHTVDWRTLG